MTEPAAAPEAPRGAQTPRNPVAAHPVASAAIAILIAACFAGTLYVPIYARTTPRVGDFPFFYFYLLIYIPAVAIALAIIYLLQQRLQQAPSGGQAGSAGEVTE